MQMARISNLLQLLTLGMSSLSIARTIPTSGLVHTDRLAQRAANETIINPIHGLLNKRDDDPADFGWIKRWAAVGDSFTAGIGSGSPLGSALSSADDWKCSRYDRAYGKVLNRAFGSAVDNFQFVACSGDRTEDIYKQIQDMEGDLDLVIMTAGGNDLCLADMISSCVFFKHTDDECEEVISVAQDNIDTILKDNIRQVIEALDDKMNEDSIVVVNGYAQFFNTDEDDDCGGQDWTLFPPLGTALPLTLARRKKFNDLVVQINSAIKDVVEDIASSSNTKFTIGFSNWDPWVYSGVSGQFCDPSSTGEYPDSKQEDLQFFKRNTMPAEGSGELKRRDGMESNPLWGPSPGTLSRSTIASSSLRNSRNPSAVALKKLDPRAPTPPSCPGDGSWTDNIPVSDAVGKSFHPNEQGHITIASFASQRLMELRAQVLGVDAGSCPVADVFTCWQKEGRKAYASADRMNANYKTFCEKDMKLVYRGGSVGYIGSATYHKGTPDEHVFAVQLSESASTRSEEDIRSECLESMDRIINSCDGNDPGNPMNWKFGGQWQRDDNYWEVTALADNRPWPVIQEPDGSCKGWYHGYWSSYEIYGAGFSDWDHGQKTLWPSANECGGAASMWDFEYLDEPTKEGYEWKANFNKLIWVRARCFGNNKVVEASGGYTHGCGGND